MTASINLREPPKPNRTLASILAEKRAIETISPPVVEDETSNSPLLPQESDQQQTLSNFSNQTSSQSPVSQSVTPPFEEPLPSLEETRDILSFEDEGAIVLGRDASSYNGEEEDELVGSSNLMTNIPNMTPHSKLIAPRTKISRMDEEEELSEFLLFDDNN